MSSAAVWLTPNPFQAIPDGSTVLTGHRSESWRWDLLTLDDAPAGILDGVTGGQVEQNVANTIRGGGSLTWAGVTPPVWSQVRVQPWYQTVSPYGETMSWPLGVFIPAAPRVAWSDTGQSVSVELYDKLLVLDQDKVDQTFTVAAGVVVTAAVRSVILGAGETRMSLVDSPETLAAPMVWEAGTSKLRIVNDLLAAINYFSIWCDGFGAYRGEPYAPPQQRDVAWPFADGPRSVFEPDFTHSRDAFNTPNKLVLVARSDGASAALTSTVTDMSGSATGFPARGRWVVAVETDVEATSQAVLDAIAARRLAELSRVGSSLDIAHAPLPLALNDVVTFKRTPAGLDLLAVVQSMTVSTEVGASVRTTLREVVAS